MGLMVVWKLRGCAFVVASHRTFVFLGASHWLSHLFPRDFGKSLVKLGCWNPCSMTNLWRLCLTLCSVSANGADEASNHAKK